MINDSNQSHALPLRGILFDFGGVLSEEGFRRGLQDIASANALHPAEFIEQAEELIYKCGYITGKTDEKSYWRQLRELTGIVGTDDALRSMILQEFRLRSRMLDFIGGLKGRLKLGLLSDQTNWLDELNARYGFFDLFDAVFNSYYLGKSKHNASVFTDACIAMNISPAATLFVDDRIANIERAAAHGLYTIHYTDQDAFLKDIARYL